MLRIAINGFGRIGRNVVRALYESGRNSDIQIVAINEIAEPKGIAHLLKYDTSHGRFGFSVDLQAKRLIVAGDEILLLQHENIADLPWHQLDIDLVLECSGVHKDRASGQAHLDQGAKKVLFSQPCGSDMDATVIYGINDHQLKADDLIVSSGSCTTNCIVPVIQVLDDAFKVLSGTITTIHSSMHDQQVIDAGKFEAIAVRVPTINVTAMDLSVTLEKHVCIDEVNQALKQARVGRLEGILDYTEEPLVSVDFNHDPHSCIVDGSQTRVSHKQLAKTLVWCDNEWGFANRMIDNAIAMFSIQ